MHLREILAELWNSLPWPIWVLVLGVIVAGWIGAIFLYWPQG